MLAFVPAAALPQFTPVFHPHHLVDPRSRYVHEHQITLDDLLEAELLAQRRWVHAVRIQQEQRARLQEEQRQRRLALVRAEQERRHQAYLRQLHEQALLEEARSRRSHYLGFSPVDLEEILVAPLQQAAVRRQQEQAAARAQAIQAVRQRELQQAQLIEQAIRQQEAQRTPDLWQAPSPARPVSRQPHVARCARHCQQAMEPQPQQAPVSFQPTALRQEAPRPKHVHFDGDDAFSLLASLLGHRDAPPNQPTTVPSAAPKPSTTTPQAAQPVKDVKGKGKAKAEPEPTPIAAPVPQRKPSAADQVTVGDLLQGRLATETDPEVLDTLHALMASLQPQETQNPFAGLFSAQQLRQPAASSSGSQTPAPSTYSAASASSSRSAGSSASEPTVVPDTVQRRRSLESIRSLAQSFHTLADGFAFPRTLDFSRPPSPVAPAALAFTHNNAPLHEYENALGKLLAQLDAIDSNGDAEVRTRRKELVREVEQALEAMDAMIAARRAESETKEAPVVAAPEATPVVADAAVEAPVATLASEAPEVVAERAEATPIVADVAEEPVVEEASQAAEDISASIVPPTVTDDSATVLADTIASAPTVDEATEESGYDATPDVPASTSSTDATEIFNAPDHLVLDTAPTEASFNAVEVASEPKAVDAPVVAEDAAVTPGENSSVPPTEPEIPEEEQTATVTPEEEPVPQPEEDIAPLVAIDVASTSQEVPLSSVVESSTDAAAEVQPSTESGDAQVQVTEAADTNDATEDEPVDSTNASVATITQADVAPAVADEPQSQPSPAILPVDATDFEVDASSESDFDLDSNASEAAADTFLLSASRPASPTKRRPSHSATSDADDAVLVDVGGRSDEETWSEVDA